jgi:hypothetical protein
MAHRAEPRYLYRNQGRWRGRKRTERPIGMVMRRRMRVVRERRIEIQVAYIPVLPKNKRRDDVSG